MIQAGSQVSVKFKQRDQVVIKMGNVVSIHGATAMVYFPTDRTRREVDVNQLQTTEQRFGVSRTNINPVRRGIN